MPVAPPWFPLAFPPAEEAMPGPKPVCAARHWPPLAPPSLSRHHAPKRSIAIWPVACVLTWSLCPLLRMCTARGATTKHLLPGRVGVHGYRPSRWAVPPPPARAHGTPSAWTPTPRLEHAQRCFAQCNTPLMFEALWAAMPVEGLGFGPHNATEPSRSRSTQSAAAAPAGPSPARPPRARQPSRGPAHSAESFPARRGCSAGDASAPPGGATARARGADTAGLRCGHRGAGQPPVDRAPAPSPRAGGLHMGAATALGARAVRAGARGCGRGRGGCLPCAAGHLHRAPAFFTTVGPRVEQRPPLAQRGPPRARGPRRWPRARPPWSPQAGGGARGPASCVNRAPRTSLVPLPCDHTAPSAPRVRCAL
jgi:hypothetical protein